jgi:zinc ribbon protein
VNAMAEAPGQGIQRELSIGEILSKMFEVYRMDFTQYITIFLVVQLISGVLTAIVTNSIVIPTLPPNYTSQQAVNLLPSIFAAAGTLLVLVLVIGLILSPLSTGTAVVMASDRISKGQVNMQRGVRYVLSRLVWMWVLGLVVGIIVGLGFIALIVPGIILGIMFSLTLPVLLIEKVGVGESMGRSRKLVRGRWGKSFVLYLLVGIFVAIAAVVISLIAGPFGSVSSIVSSLLSAFYLPLLPIGLTVYYYSNVARTAPQPSMQPMGAPAQPGYKYCQNCGAQIPEQARFCPKCSAMQPS